MPRKKQGLAYTVHIAGHPLVEYILHLLLPMCLTISFNRSRMGNILWQRRVIYSTNILLTSGGVHYHSTNALSFPTALPTPFLYVVGIVHI